MFGSDHADNAAAELAKLRTAGLSEEELVWVLGGTALRVFGLDG
jgi:predicted TIM-barrel fold metal-dependent hydrolase